MVNKHVLRRTYLEKRLFLSDAEYEERNRLLLKKCIDSIDLSAETHLHIFLPIVEKKEVNTWLFIHHLRSTRTDIHLYTSRALPGGALVHYPLTEDTRLQVNKWGIPEPAESEPVIPAKLDIILIPLIICDKNGHRIGYGKGYYDRFLRQYPDARKIGVSLSPPLDKIQFMEDMDVAMDQCLTPFQSYTFR